MSEPLDILLFGDPRLRVVSRQIHEADLEQVMRAGAGMLRTLTEFQTARGWGRAIAAPQVGVALRLVAFDFGHGPFLALNPRLTWRSDETAIVYDDCFSLPEIAAPVVRHVSVTLAFEDEKLQTQVLDRLPFDLAELAQHEIDHLDGILFVDRITDVRSIVARAHRPAPGAVGGI